MFSTVGSLRRRLVPSKFLMDDQPRSGTFFCLALIANAKSENINGHVIDVLNVIRYKRVIHL